MIFDLIIVGGGPAGVTASIYASRNNLKTLLITDNLGGALSSKAVSIENYTGFPSISGIELAFKFEEHFQAQKDIQIEYDRVSEIIKDSNLFKIKTSKKEFQSRAIIIASGAEARKLNLKGEDQFLGKGVGYCTVCDGPLFKNKDVVIVGGGNAGFESAIFLSSIAKNIYIFERENVFLADRKNQDIVKSLNNVKTFTNASILEIKGTKLVEAVKWKYQEDVLETKVQGVFIQAGYLPKTEYLKEMVEINKKGEIIVDLEMRTKTKGLFAAGDITNSRIKQIICAASDGAKAALSVCNYLNYEQN